MLYVLLETIANLQYITSGAEGTSSPLGKVGPFFYALFFLQFPFVYSFAMLVAYLHVMIVWDKHTHLRGLDYYLLQFSR